MPSRERNEARNAGRRAGGRVGGATRPKCENGTPGSGPQFGHTGRIGSRQQLAENVWLVSLGCSGGVQRYCGVHLYIIQLGLQGKPILLKIGRFSLYACGNGVDLPHLAKRVFRDQIGPNVQKAMLLGSPSHQGLKNCGLSHKIFFFIFDHFFSFW